MRGAGVIGPTPLKIGREKDGHQMILCFLASRYHVSRSATESYKSVKTLTTSKTPKKVNIRGMKSLHALSMLL